MVFLAATHLPDPEASHSYMEQELDQIREWRTSGTLLTFVVRVDGTGAYLLLDTDDANAADALMSTLPLVVGGAMTYDLISVTDSFYPSPASPPQLPVIEERV